MRRLALAAAALLVPACGLVSFDIDQDLPQQTVQGSPNPLAGLLPSFLQVPLNIDINAETKKRDTGPAHSANLKALSLSATPHGSPSGNFDFLDSVHIYIDSPNNASLPQKEIATLDPVPKGQTTVHFTVHSSVDLLPYINAGARIDSSATGHQPTKDFTFDGHITVTVNL